MKSFITNSILLLLFCQMVALSQLKDTVYLSDLDLSNVRQGWGEAQKDKSLDGNPITIAKKVFVKGVGSHAKGEFRVNLKKGSERFLAYVGVDDEAFGHYGGTVDFQILGDGKLLWKSNPAHTGWPAQKVDLDVRGIEQLVLKIGDLGDGINWDHANWADAKFIVIGEKPEAYIYPIEKPYILTPIPSSLPKINGPKIFGARPGNPFQYQIPATGKRPMEFYVDDLPDGLVLDKSSGLITGKVEKKGEYNVTLYAKNELGTSSKKFKIVIGDKIALTPPLGWNSWNCFAESVSDEKIRDAADAMSNSGLINHGWSYINIDDCWEIKVNSKDSLLGGEVRNKNGMINTNKKFPDMKTLSDYVHSKGLKLGIYSSPGPRTCAGYAGSYSYEENDAKQYAEWGIDYLKYDWCSYSEIAKDRSLHELQKPYIVMREALNKVNRDIVYSLCQYGMGNVWEWGESVGGNCWRTTGDIVDNWQSVEQIGFSQAGKEKFAKPGHWNDPDMLVVGKVGWGEHLHNTRLTPNEQYTHISLWCLLSAPLLIGCDMTQLDDFTLNLLTNDEVLEVNQDPLGKQATRVSQVGDLEVWKKDLEDGSIAVGLFNRSEDKAQVIAKWKDLKLKGKQKVRDLWRQSDIGIFNNEFKTEVPRHGVILVKMTKVK